jgi:tryptophan-rich sensory protein
MSFVRISEKAAIIFLYSINWLVFATETVCLLRGTNLACDIIQRNLSLEIVKHKYLK